MQPICLDVGQPGRRYAVEIGEGLAAQLPAFLDRHAPGQRRLVVTSARVWKAVADAFPAGIRGHEPLLLPDGERFKMLPTVARLYDTLVGVEADRGTTLVAVGGGVVGDTAGFAAATFLRGLPLVHVPTTLVAQVDSAIGGKVGVNHSAGKNLIGAFYPPRAVLVDPALLSTLPRRDFRAGLYEVVKYGAIASRALFDRAASSLAALFARESDALVPVVADCCRIKARIVTADEHEAGERRVLNFGHTVGHALETITRYRRFLHGEAVGYGMLAAMQVGVSRGTVGGDDASALAGLITQLGPLPPVGDLAVSDALEALRLDKKVVDRRLHYVVPTGIGSVTIVDDVTEDELADALSAIGLRR